MEANHHGPIAVLGAGSWGTALALHLARNGQEVRLWTFDSTHAAEMQRDRVNHRYMPNYTFPETLHPTELLADAISGVKDILIAIPSAGFRNTLTLLKPLLKHPVHFISATKGLDLETGQLPHDVMREIMGNDFVYAALSGPSFAREVAAGLPTAVVIACQNEATTKAVMARFNSAVFRTYSSHDVTGVETGGVVKNVLAIACGISDGMGFGANARSALITRGLAEMIRFGIALGGEYETFMGLAGVGDLVLTCTDDQSRNRRFGLNLGKGMNPHDAEKQIGQVVEGKRNAELVAQLAHQKQVEMPITQMVWAILQNKLTPKEAMRHLLARETGTE